MIAQVPSIKSRQNDEAIDTSIQLDIIRQFENIDHWSYGALHLLESIWQRGVDQKFNETIDKLMNSIDAYRQSGDTTAVVQLTAHRDKLETYSTIFSIDIERDIKNGLVAQMMHSHVVDAWRIILLQICNDMQRVINIYLWSKKRKLGLYIERLQNTFGHKNRSLHEQKSIVAMLGKLIKSAPTQLSESAQPIDQEYEMVVPKSYSMFGYWFRD